MPGEGKKSKLPESLIRKKKANENGELRQNYAGS